MNNFGFIFTVYHNYFKKGICTNLKTKAFVSPCILYLFHLYGLRRDQSHLPAETYKNPFGTFNIRVSLLLLMVMQHYLAKILA